MDLNRNYDYYFCENSKTPLGKPTPPLRRPEKKECSRSTSYAYSKDHRRPKFDGNRVDYDKYISDLMERENMTVVSSQTQLADLNDLSNLPYYIIPVIYVPHKPLFEAKQMIKPSQIEAHLKRNFSKYPYDIPRTASIMGPEKTTKPKEEKYAAEYTPMKAKEKRTKTNVKYSFEYYDQYFKEYIDNKIPPVKSSCSDISLFSNKSQRNFAEKQLPTNFDVYKCVVDDKERNNYGWSNVYPQKEYLKPDVINPDMYKKELQPKPWEDIHRQDQNICTDRTPTLSMKTSTQPFEMPKPKQMSNQETQTFIKDVKKVVLVVPSEKIKKPDEEEIETVAEKNDSDEKMSHFGRGKTPTRETDPKKYLSGIPRPTTPTSGRLYNNKLFSSTSPLNSTNSLENSPTNQSLQQ